MNKLSNDEIVAKLNEMHYLACTRWRFANNAFGDRGELAKPLHPTTARRIVEHGELLRVLKAIVASADECGVSSGPGVPLVAIDARLIDQARALLT